MRGFFYAVYSAKTIEQYADIFGFTLYNMGFDKLPNPPKKSN